MRCPLPKAGKGVPLRGAITQTGACGVSFTKSDRNLEMTPGFFLGDRPIDADLSALASPPALPDLAELERAFADAGVSVTAHDVKKLSRIGKFCRSLVRKFRLQLPVFR